MKKVLIAVALMLSGCYCPKPICTCPPVVRQDCVEATNYWNGELEAGEINQDEYKFLVSGCEDVHE